MAEINANWVDKAYEGKSAAEVASAPVDALQGVSAADAAKLQQAFGVKSVKELAQLKYVQWAQDIAAAARVTSKQLDKAYEHKTAAELVDAPVDALQGVSANDAALLQAAFGIKTIGDLASNKFVHWAQTITNKAD